jgi:hypothetical protein
MASLRASPVRPTIMRKCDYCGRESADDAAHCRECGTPFAVEDALSASQQPAATDNPVCTLAEKQMFRGALWCIGGALVTGATLLAASGPSGGTYIVAWGAILFGAIEFLKGWAGRNRQPDLEDVGYEALAHATKLETQGRTEEAMAAYQQIAERCAHTNAGRDALKSLENLSAKRG